ncbi:hypothetical protein COE98_12410 [Bacillus wiedmannii]|nr:hypothetical protein CN646_28350 [Bacillus wiedmannii]PEK57823.1 hypothetical protein CN595_24965 [Bacillus wiedmannii]PEL55786.1 hypothetical protein CN622_26020 [Bacillus wiedmannii]PEO16427.1 hypothetical protein CN562_05760 [Bacillus wiedmannii]PEU26493.1 hypothetical protein CN526_16435 [Bacillus wiedmannii]
MKEIEIIKSKETMTIIWQSAMISIPLEDILKVYKNNNNITGSVAKFFNRQKGKLCTIKFYTIASNRCNSLYVEKTKFGRKLRFRLYIA